LNSELTATRLSTSTYV